MYPSLQAGVKPTGADYERFQAARDKKGSAEVKDAATSRADSFTDVEVKNNATADGWTDEQNKFLVQALEAVPKDAKMKESERWKKVAACVPGKDAKQCFERYKTLREEFRGAKKG